MSERRIEAPVITETKTVRPTPELERTSDAQKIANAVSEELLGTPNTPGLLQNVDQMSTPEQRQAVVEQLGYFISRCGLLFLAGYTESALTGVQGFRAAVSRLQAKCAKLTESGIVLERVYLDKEQECATVLESAARLSSVHPDASVLSRIVDPFSATDYARLQEKFFENRLRFRGHFALKIHLRKYLVEHNLTHIQDDTGEFKLEPNNAITAFASVYEETLFPTLDWDEATRIRLTAEYQALAGTYDSETFERSGGLLEEVLTLRTKFNTTEESAALSEGYRQYLSALASFDQRWLNLELAFSRVPRKQA